MNKFKQAREGLDKAQALIEKHTLNIDEFHLVLGGYLGKAKAALAIAERMQWRDISEAPKDGASFIAMGHEYGYSNMPLWVGEAWYDDDRGEFVGFSKELGFVTGNQYATRWMPLPETKRLEDE